MTAAWHSCTKSPIFAEINRSEGIEPSLSAFGGCLQRIAPGGFSGQLCDLVFWQERGSGASDILCTGCLWPSDRLISAKIAHSALGLPTARKNYARNHLRTDDANGSRHAVNPWISDHAPSTHLHSGWFSSPRTSYAGRDRNPANERAPPRGRSPYCIRQVAYAPIVPRAGYER